MLNVLKGTHIYMKLNVHGAYTPFQGKDGDYHKLAFQMRYSLFKSTLMQFGTRNNPVDVQVQVSNVIKEAFDDFAPPPLDAILTDSHSEENYLDHVKWVIQCFLEAGLYWKHAICEFQRERK